MRKLPSANVSVQSNEQFDLLLASELPIFLKDNILERVPTNEDISSLHNLLGKLTQGQNQMKNKLLRMKDSIEQLDFSKGISYFNGKNLIFIEYLIHLQFYELFKVNGIDFTKDKGLKLYQRLVYLKTLLTKLGPIEKKLQYQKNKILKYSQILHVQAEKRKASEDKKQLSEEEDKAEVQVENQEQSDEDILAYRPRIEDLKKIQKQKLSTQLKEGKYVAPKISSVLSKEDKVKRRLQFQKQRKKAFLIRKYRDDLVQDDEARQQGVDSEIAEKIKRKFQQKTTIEEENFTRFRQTKKQKFWKKSLVKNQFRKSHLEDDLNDINMIKQIFQEQKGENEIVNLPERKRHLPSKLKAKAGTKKIKK